MYNVSVSGKKMIEVYELIGILRKKNIDFNFTYVPPTDTNYERTIVFHFKDQKIALWFSMVFK